MQTQRGFTLLEVLVAFVICAFLLGAFLQVFSTGLRQGRVTDTFGIATLHAESLLAAIGKKEPVIQGERYGQIDDQFRWRVSIQPYEEEEDELDQPALIPYHVTLTILWKERETERTVSLSTLRLAKTQ